MVARAKHELRADVHGALFIRTEHQRRVPVKAQLRLAVPRIRLDGARFVRHAVDPLDFTALRLDVDISRVGGIFPHPEAVAAAHIFPARIAHAAGIRRIRHKATVVLQPSVHTIRLGVIRADVVELRNRQVHQMFPARAAVLAAPQPAIVAGEHHVGIRRIDPDVVKIAVSVGHRAETAPAIHAEQQRSIDLEQFVFVLGVDDQIGEIKGTPHLVLAGIQARPVLAAVRRAVKSAAFRLDGGVDHLRLGGSHRQRDAAVRLLGQAFGIGGRKFGPLLAAIGGFEQAAARAARAKGPGLPPEIPHGGVDGLGILRGHGQHAASGRAVCAGQHLPPGLSAIAGLVNAALVVVVPQVSCGTRVDDVAVFGIDQNLRDVFGILEAGVLPVFAAVDGFVDAVADRHAVAHPAFPSARPYDLRVGGIDGHRADGLHVGEIEHGLECGSSVDRLPDAAAGRRAEYGEPSAVVDGGDCGDAAAHFRRADIARGQAGYGAGIVPHGRLRKQRGGGQEEAEKWSAVHGHFPFAGAAGILNSAGSIATLASILSMVILLVSPGLRGLPDSSANGK